MRQRKFSVMLPPGPREGEVHIPASKSVAHRLLICAALADRPTRIAISAMNRDIEATVDCLKAMGADIRGEGDTLSVTPIARIPAECALDCGESGSTLRFLLPVAAALGVKARMTDRKSVV